MSITHKDMKPQTQEIKATLERWVKTGQMLLDTTAKYTVVSFNHSTRAYILLYAPYTRWSIMDGVVASSEAIGLRAYAVYDGVDLVYDSVKDHATLEWLSEPASWLSDHESNVWRHILKPLGVNWEEFKQLIPEEEEVIPIQIGAGRKGFIQGERWRSPQTSVVFESVKNLEMFLQQMGISVEFDYESKKS